MQEQVVGAMKEDQEKQADQFAQKVEEMQDQMIKVMGEMKKEIQKRQN